MTDSLLRRAMPRGFRPQFSLASTFIFMTASAVATWYWYQRPFPVERMVVSLDPICMVGVMEPAPKNFRQVHYVHRVWGGKTIEHGPYRGYDSQGNLLHVGTFRNGQEHGDFILYNPAGRKIAHWNVSMACCRALIGAGTIAEICNSPTPMCMESGRGSVAVGIQTVTGSKRNTMKTTFFMVRLFIAGPGIDSSRGALSRA